MLFQYKFNCNYFDFFLNFDIFFPTQTNSEQGGLLADYHHRNPRSQSQDVLQQSQLSCQ